MTPINKAMIRHDWRKAGPLEKQIGEGFDPVGVFEHVATGHHAPVWFSCWAVPDWPGGSHQEGYMIYDSDADRVATLKASINLPA